MQSGFISVMCNKNKFGKNNSILRAYKIYKYVINSIVYMRWIFTIGKVTMRIIEMKDAANADTPLFVLGIFLTLITLLFRG